MWKRPFALLFALAFIAFGCGGDSRQSFVGTYNSNTVTTFTLQGAGSQTTTSSGPLTITTGQGSNKIVMPSGGCNFTATVNSDTSFTVDPITCPPAPCGGTCTCVLSVTQGNGARSGTTLTINASGNVVISGCGSATGTFSQVTTATKV